MQEEMAALCSGQEKLQSQLIEGTRKRKAAECKAQRLDECLKHANADRFGDKRQKVKKDPEKTEEPDRNKEKDDFDGTGDTLRTDSVIRENRDELFAYLDDGELPIDNNLAERCIRKLTTQRNSMLHFGSDEGVEMAAAYHSIISTVKLHGKSAWHFLGTFFTKIFNGCRDFFSLTPGNIEMAAFQ